MGRTGGFIQQMMGVLTPIADGIQGIVDLIGGWENALLVILGLFAGKLILAVSGVVLGIAQLGAGIAGMATAGLGAYRPADCPDDGPDAERSSGRSSNGECDRGTVAGAAGGTVLSRLGSGVLGASRFVAPPVAFLTTLLASSATNRGNDEFEAEQEREHLRREGYSPEQIDLFERARDGASLDELWSHPAATGLSHEQIAQLFRDAGHLGSATRVEQGAVGAALGEYAGGEVLRDAMGLEDGADAIQEAIDAMNEASRHQAGAADAWQRAAETRLGARWTCISPSTRTGTCAAGRVQAVVASGA